MRFGKLRKKLLTNKQKKKRKEKKPDFLDAMLCFFWGGMDRISYGVSEVAASGFLASFFSQVPTSSKKNKSYFRHFRNATKPQRKRLILTIATEHTLNTPNAIGPRQETESRFALFRLCNIIV